ncbi:MAG: hypothetical protein GY835_21410 [bacterium]|nr:hypothetical protein [bacterium]
MFEKLIRTGMPILALLAILIPTVADAAVGDIHPTSIPDELVALTDEVTITWLEPVEAILQVGPSALEWTVDVVATSSSAGTLTFTPQTGGVSAGVWAARLLVPGTEQSSLPFYLLVEASNAPLMTAPQNGSEIEGGTTLLAWEPVLGVPYYHVVFSDQEIVIGEDENGDATITGANIIWQVIVSSTSVEYGAGDPSGFFNDMNGTSPPLVPGTDYNWLVLNNYGNNPGLTSTKQAGVSSFTVADNLDILPPDLLLPAAQDTITDDTITFSWTEVDGAAHYHFYLSRVIDSDDSEGSVAVYDQLTGQTLIDLPASSMLVEARHMWKVFALDETGQGVASELREFVYEIGMGTLSITTRNEAGATIPYVDVDLTPLAGGGSSVPILIGSGGTSSEDILPGTYRLTSGKTGYETTVTDVVVAVGQTTSVTIVLPESPATITGIVRTNDLTPIPFADIQAVNTTTDEMREIAAGSGGDFQIGVLAGTWSLTAGKTGYHAGTPVEVTIVPGEYHEMADYLPLIPNTSTISGSVISDSGQPMISATVTAISGDAEFTRLTGTDGMFQFSLDAADWTITAAKSGYVASAPREINLDPGEDLTLDPPLTLSAQASIVSGFVITGGSVLAGAQVTATPEAGASLVMQSGALGNFQFSLSSGTWVLSTEMAGYTPGETVQLTLAPGSSQSGVELVLIPNPCTVSGTISDGGAGIGSATISNGEAEILSSWNGNYSIALPSGTQTLNAWKSGYGNGEAVALDLAPGQTLTGIDFLLSPNAATVNGQVLYGDLPVAGARIFLATAVDTLIRDCDQLGYFTVSSTPGQFTLWAEKEGMVSDLPGEITLGPGQVLNDVTLGLEPATATLSGTVTSGGSTLREVEISAVSAAGEANTTSNLDGTWTLVVPAGFSWDVTVWKSGYNSDSAQSPELSNGGTWEHDFALAEQPALLSGYVSDDDSYLLNSIAISITGDAATDIQTGSDGFYQVSLQPGNYTIAIDLPGYLSYSQAVTLAVGAQELDIVMTTLFASLTGTVRDGAGDILIGANLTAASTEGGGSASTDDAGAYTFPRLLPGVYQVEVSLPGYGEVTQAITLGNNVNAVEDFVLVAFNGYLSGAVLDDLGDPLAAVSLQVFDGTEMLAQSLSDAEGEFHIEALPIDRTLSLSASITGYAAQSQNPLTGLTAPTEGLSFSMVANSGIIRGIVRDSATLLPIDDAAINVDDGNGFFGSAESDSTGAFYVRDLRAASTYTVRIDAAGWAATELTSVEPDSSLILVELVSAPASVYGLLTVERDEEGFTLPAGSSLLAIPIEGSSREAEIPLTSLGDFDLSELFPGTYSLMLRVDGYITEPRSRTIEVTENSTTGPFNFMLIAAPLFSIQVNGEEALDNDGSYLFRGALTSDEGEQVDYPVTWACYPPDAGALDNTSGRFSPRADYIGEVRLEAMHEGSGVSGSKTVNVFARISPTEEYELDNGNGLSFHVPVGAVTQAVSVTVSQLAPSTIKRRAGDYRVEGDIYHFLPDGLSFEEESNPTLVLPIPNKVFNCDMALGWWDPEGLAWEAMAAVKWVDGLANELEHFSDYALLVANDNLGIQSPGIAPNPFSPDAGAGVANITYTISSTVMGAPPVDIKIYNMIGDLVRTLVDHQTRTVGEVQREEWDGRTDAGNMARNGRYIVRITVEDNSGTEEKILQAVLIK